MLRVLCSVGRETGMNSTQKYCSEAQGGGLWGEEGNTLLGDKQRSLEPQMDRQ